MAKNRINPEPVNALVNGHPVAAAKPKRSKKKTKKVTAKAPKPAAKRPQAKKPKKAPAKPAKAKLSALDAAAKVLGESKEPMTCKEMIEAMAKKGYWKSPGGQTPHATLYSAILREMNNKGKDARFNKVERGKFTLA